MLGSLASPRVARADGAPEDRAAADALFTDARALMKRGHYAEACPKLVASQRLDPAIGTLLQLGYCYLNDGKTASAWASFNDAEAMARKANDRPRADDAARQAKALEPKLSKLTIEVPDRAAGLEVKRDGKPVDAALFGSAIPVDPGEHTVEATQPGKQPWSAKVTVASSAGTTLVKVPVLTAPLAEPGSPNNKGPGQVGSGKTWSGQRTAGLVVGGVGLAGVVIGAVFGVRTLGKVSDAKGHCSTATSPPRCDEVGLQLNQDAVVTGNVSTASLVIGGAAVVTGVVLFATAPSGEAKAGARWSIGPAVGMGSGGAVIRGVW